LYLQEWGWQVSVTSYLTAAWLHLAAGILAWISDSLLPSNAHSIGVEGKATEMISQEAGGAEALWEMQEETTQELTDKRSNGFYFLK